MLIAIIMMSTLLNELVLFEEKREHAGFLEDIAT